MNTTWQYTINAAIGLILAGLVGYLKCVIAEFRFIRRGVTAMLHNQLYRTCETYLQRGWVTKDDLEDLEELYQCYRGFGMNGVGEELYKRCRKLEIK